MRVRARVRMGGNVAYCMVLVQYILLNKYLVHSVIYIYICTSFITIRRHLSVACIRERTIIRLIILYLAVQVQSVQSTFWFGTLSFVCVLCFGV